VTAFNDAPPANEIGFELGKDSGTKIIELPEQVSNYDKDYYKLSTTEIQTGVSRCDNQFAVFTSDTTGLMELFSISKSGSLNSDGNDYYDTISMEDPSSLGLFPDTYQVIIHIGYFTTT
jgi:hypothetical protein